MTDKHNYSFFGQKVAVIVNSPSQNEPYIFFSFIKKLDNGKWEKLSNKEGKVIKFSLEEMVMIHQVLEHKSDSWSAFHSFQERKTQISFKWEKKQEETNLVISLNGYSKPLTFSQIEIMRMLIKHMLKEKIEFATGKAFDMKKSQDESKDLEVAEAPEIAGPEEEQSEVMESTYIEEEVEPTNSKKTQSQTSVICTILGESEKALKLSFKGGQELWIPKSVIHSKYDSSNNEKHQKLLIDTWILTKNHLIS